MKIDNAFEIGVLGLKNSVDGVNKNAAKIASVDMMKAEDPAGMAKPLVGLKVYEMQGQASAKVIKTVDTMVGSLFNDKA